MCTALVGLLGALIALMFETSNNLDNALMYVLPFTAGGFLNIALVSLVPDLMQVAIHTGCSKIFANSCKLMGQPNDSHTPGEEPNISSGSAALCYWRNICHVSTDSDGVRSLDV